ncbi:MAG: hypothetical protein ACYSUP_13960, partial [Planctomycetota bacterium]
PFLVLVILCIGLPAFWLYSRFLKPRFLKAPKNELNQQTRLFVIMSKIFGCAAAVFLGWATFISLSFLDLDALSFLICAAFIAIILFGIYKNIHFIYLQLPLILLALLLTKGKPGHAGTYIYPFVLLPAYVVTHLLASLLSRTVKIRPLSIIFPAATAVAAFLLMVAIFNPFRFGRLFNVVPELQSSLDNRTMPQRLRTTFENKGISLSEDVTVLVKQPGSKWLIIDDHKKYPVSSERRRLYVYKPGSPVWQIKEALHIKRMWSPRYEGQYKPNYAHLFAVLYFINIASVALYVLIPYLRMLFSATTPDKADQSARGEPYQLPKIDLALMAVAALTVYMAYRSRRFIPIAAIAACPVLAMFIDQMARTISAAFNFHRGLPRTPSAKNNSGKRSSLVVTPMPLGLQAFFVVIGAAVVLGLGTWWLLRFKCVYLDPWPTDPKLSSAFMRMTASDAKPFYALDFIRENKIEGKMFNYWTEGGFVAYGQDPDPNTGRTPLRLFMDGRAQAAYMIRAYDRWSQIMSGGRITATLEAEAKARGQKLQPAQYKKIGEWITGELRSENVWAVLMPSGQFHTPFVKGLEHDANWRLIFLNNKQKLFVHMDEPQAKALYDGIFDGSTFYPDDFSKDLIMAFHLLRGNEAQRRQGFDLAVKAFELNPSQAPMHQIIYAARFPELRADVTRACQDYLKRFDQNHSDWSKQDGQHHRIVAALNAAGYLRQLANRARNTELSRSYSARISDLNAERNKTLKYKRW